MKPLIVLAAAGLSTLVALPHLPSAATIKDEFAALHLSLPTQPDQAAQPAQDPAAAPAADQAGAPADTAPDLSNPPTSEPFVAKASPDEVRQSYGEPQSVERTAYGETWYYPVYIIYFRNGFVHRSLRPGCSAPTGTASTAASTAPVAATSGSRAQSWRFSTSSSLGAVSLNGAGVRYTNTSASRTTAGVAPTMGSSSAVHYSGSTSTSGSTSRSSAPAPTSTRTVSAPRSVPAAPSQSYSRSGPVGY